jgi:hypothetical protein
MVRKGYAVNHASNSDSRWLTLIKTTIARFSRGNIAAQRGRILTPDEQKREHAQARKIARKWRERAKHSTAA